MTGFNVELLFRKIAKDLYVEDLDRQRQNEDSDIDDEERNGRKISRKGFKDNSRKKLFQTGVTRVNVVKNVSVSCLTEVID